MTQKFIQYFGKGRYETAVQPSALHEAQTLVLDNQKIKQALNWHPKYNADEAIQLTAQWYADKEKNASEKTIEQINHYLSRE